MTPATGAKVRKGLLAHLGSRIVSVISYSVACLVVVSCFYVLMYVKPDDKDLGTVSIATGDIGSPYYEVGGVISKLLAQVTPGQAKLKANIEPSNGSVDNIKKLVDGSVQLAIVQADVFEDALRGRGEWEGAPPINGLGLVTRLQHELITVIVPDDSEIKTVKDLKGHRVNIGPAGSGTRQNAIRVLTGAEVDWKTDITAVEYASDRSGELLKSKMIDAFFLTTSHPSKIIQDLITSGFKMRVLPLSIDKLELGDTVAIQKGKIPVETYGGALNRAPVETLQVTALLLASLSTKDAVIYEVTKRLFEDTRKLGAMLPALNDLTKQSATVGGVGEMHGGARQYLDPEAYASSFKSVFQKK